MKFLLFLFVCFLTACSSSTTLEEGRWTGNLTPMNHPDMNQPIGYDLSYQNNELKINLIGPDGTPVALKNPRVQNDTLYFSFNEPEQQVSLDCKLAGNSENGFTGRCSDASGKWALFTMNPPE